MKVALITLTVSCVLLFSAVAFGHHSFAGTYELDQHRTINGTVVEWILRNPHSFLVLEVRDDSGRVHRWGVEWAGMKTLQDDGVTATSLHVGDKVIVTGNSSKDPNELKLLMEKIVRPSDNWIWGGRVNPFESYPREPLPATK